MSVRITYEIDQGGEKFWVYGANGQYRPTQWLELGAGVVNDENPLARFELGSANATEGSMSAATKPSTAPQRTRLLRRPHTVFMPMSENNPLMSYPLEAVCPRCKDHRQRL